MTVRDLWASLAIPLIVACQLGANGSPPPPTPSSTPASTAAPAAPAGPMASGPPAGARQPLAGRADAGAGAAAGTTTRAGSGALASIGGNDFTPARGRGTAPANTVGDEADLSGPWNLKLSVAESTDNGVSFKATGEVVAEQAGVPSAVVGADGLLRLYYIAWQDGQNFTAVAVRDADGGQWVYKKVQLTGVDLAGGNMADPSVVLLDDGRFRMYYQTNNRGQVSVLSAVSADGVAFQAESGSRYTPRTQGESPLVMRAGNQWLMVMGPFGQHVLTSSDGLSFSTSGAPSFKTPIFHFSGIALPSGGYRIYGASQRGNSDVYYSADGRSWQLESGGYWPAGEGFPGNGENATAVVGNKVLMFYTEAIDQSAATKAANNSNKGPVNNTGNNAGRKGSSPGQGPGPKGPPPTRKSGGGRP